MNKFLKAFAVLYIVGSIGGSAYLYNELRDTKADVSDIKAEKAEVESANNTLKEINSGMTDKLKQTEEATKELQKSVDDLEDKLSKAYKERDELQHQNEDLQTQIAYKKEQKAKQQAEAQAKAEEAQVVSVSTEAKTEEAPNQETTAPSGGGQVLYMESTAYSSDPADTLGGGTITATGQNLLQNPMAVAVDPNVIPLGTRLYVEGYGEAYAVDTGGAIKGNIVDVHFPTYEQCVQWGRRTVKVTILS